VPTAFDVHFEPPAAIPIPLDAGEEARIEFAMQQRGPSVVTTEMSISQTAWLHLRFAHRHSFDDAAQRVGQLRNFISLAVGRPVTVLALTGFQDDHLRPGSTSRQPIELLWEIPHNPESPARPRHPIEMFFTLPEAMPGISDVMKAWFARQDLLKPVFNLYFGMLYHPSMYSDVHFLAYAQAVETYDFRRRDPHELTPAEHKTRVKEIIDAAPDQWRGWLRMRLASSNYWTLDQRIRAVLGECPAVSAKIVGGLPEEQDAFISTCKQSRNYYTHYTPTLERKAAKDVALYLLIVQLQAMIEMSLLRELGFSCEAIDAILDRVQRYAEIRHFTDAAAEEKATSQG
jgi:ApeA N-terminal domain 1